MIETVLKAIQLIEHVKQQKSESSHARWTVNTFTIPLILCESDRATEVSISI